MTHGKRTCRILKEIRQQIADRNDIAYVTSECHYQGECKGTCPKCEAELRYLENELQKRKLMGKAAVVAGISLGIAGTFSACNVPQQKPDTSSEQEIIAETIEMDTIPAIPIDSVKDKMNLEDMLIHEVGYAGGEPWIVIDDTTKPILKMGVIPIEEDIEMRMGKAPLFQEDDIEIIKEDE